MYKELKVKVGDEVLYKHNQWGNCVERIEIVKKITPTGRIRITGIESQFNKYGEEMTSAQTRSRLLIPTVKDRKRIEENNAIQKALLLMDGLNAKTLTYDKASKIIEILSD